VAGNANLSSLGPVQTQPLRGQQSNPWYIPTELVPLTVTSSVGIISVERQSPTRGHKHNYFFIIVIRHQIIRDGRLTTGTGFST
jgi:hypothetical protein